MFAKILRFKEIGKRMPKKEMKKMKTEPPFLSALHAKNDTTNLFDYKLGESPENNKLYFSSQTFNGPI